MKSPIRPLLLYFLLGFLILPGIAAESAGLAGPLHSHRDFNATIPVVFSPIPEDGPALPCGAGACDFLAESSRLKVRIGARGYHIQSPDSPQGTGFSVAWAQDSNASSSSAQYSARSVVYRRILPGIGLRYYDAAGDLEYDFIIEPGADPSVLSFSVTGANDIRILPSGDLRIAGLHAAILQRRPVAFQWENGVRREVAASYRQTGASTFVFDLGEFDSGIPLIIDPIIEHATTFGNGRPQTGVLGLATAPDGTIVYLGRAGANLDEPPLPGEDPSRMHLVTPLAYSTHLTRFSPDLKQAIRSVFLGFVNADSRAPSLLALSPDGSIIVAEGYQDPSSQFFQPPPVSTGPFGTTTPLPPSYGPLRGSLLKVEPDLQTVVYTTVFRCTGDFLIQAITVAPNHDLVLAGRTACQDFPVSPGAYHRAPTSGESRLFLARLNSAATEMTFSTLFGGSAMENVQSVSLTANGDYVVAGTTSSTDFPVTPGVVRSSIRSEDGFVSVISADGRSLLASTLLGGTGFDGAQKAAVAPGGDIMVALSTHSEDLPVTANAFRKTRGNGFGALARVSPDLKTLRFLTYLPGMSPFRDVAFDAQGNTWLSGGAASREEGYAGSVIPPLLKPWDNLSAALLKVSADGSRLLFGTSWFGRSAGPMFASADESGISLIGSSVYPASFPHTWPAISTAVPGFEVHDVPIARLNLSDTTVCQLALPAGQVTMGHLGGAGSFPLEIAPGCPWVVVDTFNTGILKTETMIGLGNAVVPFQLRENGSSQQDVLHHLTVIGQPLTIRQLPYPCSEWTLSDSRLDFPAEGGTRTVTATLPGGCTIYQRPGALWASTSLPGYPYPTYGTIPVTVTVAPNAFAARSTVIQIIDRDLVLSQAGGICTANVTPSATAIPPGGAEVALQISTSSPSCAWSAQASSTAISFPGSDTGAGAATLRVAVAANPSNQPRSLSLFVAGVPVTLSQAAGECTVVTMNNWVDILQAGGSERRLFVASGTACVGVLETDVPWIFPSPDTIGISGSYEFHVLPNTTGQTRRATVRVLGRPVTINQLGGPATRLVVVSESAGLLRLNGEIRDFIEPSYVETGVPFTVEAPALQILPNNLLAVFHEWAGYGKELKISLTPLEDIFYLGPQFSFHKPLDLLYQGNPSTGGGSVQQTGGEAPIYTAGKARYYAGAGPVTFTAQDGPNARFVSYSGLISTTNRTVSVPADTGLALTAIFEPLGPDPGASVLGALVEGAGFRLMPVSPGSIASLFGTNLSDTTAVAQSLPLPQDLAGARVLLRINGIAYVAPLFYVSPGQINLLVPEVIPPGSGTVELIRDLTVRATLPIQIATVSPSLFAANDNGEGAPAGYAVRVSANQQIRAELAVCPAGKGSCVPALVDLGSDLDEVFLVLFGTGFRGLAGKPAVTIGGTPVEVEFAGPHSIFAGLDQINLKVPRSLRGMGELILQMRHGVVNANPLRVRF